MAYVGTPIDTNNQFQSLSGKRFDGDGSTTDFTLDIAPTSTLDIEVFVENVRQDPNSAYTVSGTTLSFTGAPPSGTNNIYVVHQAKAVGTITVPDSVITSAKLSGNLVTPGTLDVNGQELILDADADTSITADTDDQIDVKIGGTDQFSIKDGVIEPTTDNDVDIGSSSKEFKDGYFDGTLFCDTLNLAGTAHTAITGGVTSVKTVVVTSTSTYTPTSGTKFVTVYATGGGGGAGGLVSNAASYVYGSSGAGGGGGTAIRTYDEDELGANAAVTIGAGGGGASGNANGSNGGDTTFNPAGTGSTITGSGGGFGYGIDLGSGAIASGISGRGGGASNGQVNMDGHVGAVNEPGTRSSSTINVQANTGGPSFFGGFNQIRTANNGGDSGQSANSFGAGGSGAVQHNSSTNRNGGNGKAGIVVIMEYA